MGDRPPSPIRPDIRRAHYGGVVSGNWGSCVCVCIKNRVNVQFLLPQIELNRCLNVPLSSQSPSTSAALTCTLCLCHRHNDISCHICLRLSRPWMIRHVCMCLPRRPRSPPLSLSLSISHLCPASSISLGKVSGTILLTCHFRSNDFEWKARTSRNLHGPLRWDREKGIQWEGVCRGIGGRESHNSTRMQSVKICKRR